MDGFLGTAIRDRVFDTMQAAINFIRNLFVEKVNRVQRLMTLSVFAGLALFSTVACGATLQTDDFQSGTTEGWTDGVIMAPTLQTTGGPAGLDDAFLMLSTSSPTGPGSNLSSFNGSSDWAGDYTSLGAGSVMVDMMNPIGSSTLEMRLVLFGPLNVSQRWTSTLSAVVPNDGLWRSFEFSLAEEDLTRVAGFSNHVDLMGNVNRVMLRHDTGAPSPGGASISARLGIDNVSLVAGAPPLAADFDGNNVVDGDDLVQWEGDFGQNAGSDTDGDADSDGADFLVWQRQFREGAEASATLQAIPEPASCWLIVLAAFGLPVGLPGRLRDC